MELAGGLVLWRLKSRANQLRTALDRIDGTQRLSAEARMIRALTDMARRDGPHIALTQQALGDLIGVSRITIGQLLRRLGAAGLVALRYRGIELMDVAALERWEETGSSG